MVNVEVVLYDIKVGYESEGVFGIFINLLLVFSLVINGQYVFEFGFCSFYFFFIYKLVKWYVFYVVQICYILIYILFLLSVDNNVIEKVFLVLK